MSFTALAWSLVRRNPSTPDSGRPIATLTSARPDFAKRCPGRGCPAPRSARIGNKRASHVRRGTIRAVVRPVRGSWSAPAAPLRRRGGLSPLNVAPEATSAHRCESRQIGNRAPASASVRSDVPGRTTPRLANAVVSRRGRRPTDRARLVSLADLLHRPCRRIDRSAEQSLSQWEVLGGVRDRR